MIDFAQAWDELTAGQRVRVSNGQPEPGGKGLAHKVWRSHNFEGEVAMFADGPPRAIQVQLDEQEGARVAYTITEASGDLFESA